MPKLSDFKALLFDIDRTLIPRSREIFPEIKPMLSKLQKAGYTTGVCSGRGFAAIKEVIMPLFPDDSLHILAGGSLIISSTGKIIWEETIDPTSVHQLKEIVIDDNNPAIFMKPDAQYATPDVLINIQAHHWNQVGKPLSEMHTTGVGLVYIPNPTQRIESFVFNNPSLTYKDMISSAGHRYLDVTSAGVTKGLALQEWAIMTGITMDEVIGFGDSSNDLEFLELCGFAVAMGNADEEVKKIADKVIGDVDKKGLPKYIEKLLKGSEL